MDLKTLKVDELKERLATRGASTKGIHLFNHLYYLFINIT